MIGLGKMGGNMRDRLRDKGLTVVGYDRDQSLSDAADLADLVSKLTGPVKVVWIMVPDKAVDSVIAELAPLLSAGDIVIDGGNSKYTQDPIHAAELAKSGIHYLDVGVSGGVWGKANGYALMVGGAAADVAACMPVFEALKPEGPYGFVHAGKVGAGHFAKMVHNGIEYGIMQSYAEGFEIMEASDLVDDVTETFNSWRAGTVIRSWLLDLLTEAIKADPGLDSIEGYAADSGEGRWTVEAAVELGVAAPAIAAALFARFVSQDEESQAMKAIAAMRNGFGGHSIVSEDKAKVAAAAAAAGAEASAAQ